MAQAPPTQISRPDVSAPNPPVFDDIAQKSKEAFDYVDLTILQWIDERHALKRIYSTAPENYPVGGEKIMTKGAPWPETVVKRHEPYASYDTEELQATYVDTPYLTAMGVHQCICVPIFDKSGNTVAALNFLGAKDQWDQSIIPGMQELAKAQGTDAFNRFIASR
ncbi:uncharacterized protein I303_100278 [Kwoniella dejecticola CBS 10117]|uniref:GAF domain-containing protein n=1 Tax=Kwoniella dejecticola CBS 10117 TaxID=1296121 RepID=A0A1A6AEG0_9TREE|nr:uncharacterized protein I303_00279 [Kwoniella dejecticola CBS 10117]OBR88462.1 hypothetical protein I303_00279 [Kwoniella dejecticola CBS 10117]